MVFKDVTEEFFKQCNNLNIGELAHGPLFSLQDAMSAIEIMDPKMDAGVELPRRTVYLKESLENNLLIFKDFKLEDVLGIMDETLAAVVNWLEGDTLAQTVFINMYLHCVPLIEFKPLRVFCEGIKKVIIIAKNFILKASTFEEEDFCASYNRLPLNNMELTELKAAKLLKECDDEISRELRRGTEFAELYTALHHRIRFLRTLLLLLLSIERNIENSSDQPPRAPNSGNFRLECIQYADSLTGLCTSIKETLSLGTPASGKDNPREEEYGLPGFEPFLNHNLLPPTIPRYRRIMDRVDAISYFHLCVNRLKHVFGILDYESSTDHILNTWTFLRYFSQKGVNGESCLLSRSILLLLYLPPNNEKIFNNTPKVDIFKDTLRYFLNSQSWSLAQRSMEHGTMKSYIDKLCAESTTALFEIPIIYAFNRSRQRNRFEHLIETTWDLYQECNKGDACLRDISHSLNSKAPLPSVFCSSLAFFLFQIVWEYVLLGFELELYLTHELSYVYNFLSDIILYNFAAHVTEIMQQLNAGDKKSNSAGARKNKRKDKGVDECKLQFVSGYLLVIRSHYNLSCGLFYALAAFIRDKKLQVPDFPYGSEVIRFNRRFYTLLNCGWFGEANIYQRYQSQWDSLLKETPQKLYADATCFFEAAVKCIEQCPQKMQCHVANLSQVAKRNMIVCKLLSSGHKNGPDNPIHLVFEPESSMVFPMFRLG